MLRSVFFCLCASLVAMPTAHSEESEVGLTTFDELRDQGLLYARKRRPKLAMQSLNQAYAMPEGRADFKTVFHRGVVARDLLLIELAHEMAEEAEPLVGDNTRFRRDLSEFKGELNDLYGAVQVEPAQGETNRTGRIFIESQTGILNRNKRELFQSIRERFRASEITIPAKIYLPHGNYTANNVPVSVSADTVATAQVYLQIQKDLAAVSSGGVDTWWLAGTGAAAAIVGGVSAYFLLRDDAPKQVDRFLLERRAP